MEDYKLLQKFDGNPVTHQTLNQVLREFKRPNDKIRSWVKKGYLISLSRGVYVVNSEITGVLPDKTAAANILYGPSYISLEYALAYYDAIPERVEEVTSVTTKRSAVRETPLGKFSYTRIPVNWYPFGIANKKVANDRYALIATPEKALCDTVVCTRNLLLRSVKDAQRWIADMRIDEEFIERLNFKAVSTGIGAAPKTESLKNLIKAIAR